MSKLIGTTKPTIASVRDKTHWNAANIKPRNPVTLGLCSEADLEKEIALAPRRPGMVLPVVDYGSEPEEEEPRQEPAVPSFLADAMTRRPPHGGGNHS